MPEEIKEKSKRGTAPDIAVLGCLATGALACVGGLVGIATQQVAGGGVCFLAAALAFGVIAYVSLSG